MGKLLDSLNLGLERLWPSTRLDKYEGMRPLRSLACRALLMALVGAIVGGCSTAREETSAGDGTPLSQASPIRQATARPPTATREPASTAPSATAPPLRTPTRKPTGPLVVSPTRQPSPFRPDGELQPLLETILGNEAGSYGVYVKNLDDGRGASVNANAAFRAASIFKLFVMWETFRQQSFGLVDFDDLMEMTAYHKEFELGTNAVQVGELVTVRDALSLMMSISDTPTAVLLQDSIGFTNVNAALEALGIFDSGLFYPGDSLATARDLGVLLEVIAEGGLLPEASHEAMIELLLSEQTDNGLRVGVPLSVGVAHKTGLLERARHEAGIVFAPKGTYVIAVLWDRESDTNLIEVIAAAVFAHYDQR
ncbi:MAG: hypothetical protein GEU75_13355 [Dehalococcoidia bacterium]|nr:hypothetical protein [Dehalococcoidia bacterium]